MPRGVQLPSFDKGLEVFWSLEGDWRGVWVLVGDGEGEVGRKDGEGDSGRRNGEVRGEPKERGDGEEGLYVAGMAWKRLEVSICDFNLQRTGRRNLKGMGQTMVETSPQTANRYSCSRARSVLGLGVRFRLWAASENSSDDFPQFIRFDIAVKVLLTSMEPLSLSK